MPKPTSIPMVAALLTLAACQLDPKNLGTPDSASDSSTSTGTGTDPNTDSSTSPTGTSPDPGSDTTDTSTVGATDTSTVGATDTGTAGATDTGEPSDPVCGLPPDTMTGPSWPDNYVWFPAWGGVLNEPCVLEATEVTASGLKIVLDCPKHEQDLGMDTYWFEIQDGPIPVFPPIGSTLDVSGGFTVVGSSDDSETLILRSDGKLLYAAVRALTLDPTPASPDAYAPLTLARLDLCPLQPLFEDDTSGLGGDGFFCEAGGRAQLRVSSAGSDDLLLLDDGTGLIASGQTTYAVDVHRAWQMENCQPDHPQGALDMVAFAIAAQ